MSNLFRSQAVPVDNTKDKDSIRREQLISQILVIRQKVEQLQELEAEIKSIQNLIKCEQSKSQKLDKSSSTKSIVQVKRSSNSNHKIKIYELKKKLESKQKQYKDQHVQYLTKLSKQEQTFTEIASLDQQIKQQKQTTIELDRLHGSLVSDIFRIQQKCNENTGMLKQELEVRRMYQEQKIKKIQNIKKLKRIINQSSENTQPDDSGNDDEELQDSIYQPSKQLIDLSKSNNDPNSPNFKFQLTENNSPLNSPVLLSRKHSEEILIYQDQDYDQYDHNNGIFQLSFKKRPKFGNKSKAYQSLNQSKQRQMQINQPKQSYKSMQKSRDRLQQQVHILEQKINKDIKLYNNLIESISLVKRGNRNLEASAKHSMVTVGLLKNKLETMSKYNDNQGRELLYAISKCEVLYGKLRSKEGQRGEIRGRLGIKVENTRILGIINQEINLDLQKLSSRLPKLKSLSTQCLEIIKRVLGPEPLLSQNMNEIID